MKKEAILTQKRKSIAIVASFILCAVIAATSLVTTKSQHARADMNAITIAGAPVGVTVAREHMAIPIELHDGFPVTAVRGVPVDSLGLSKNSDVSLTADQVQFADRFNEYLSQRHEWAVMTSGERSPEGQLDIIKERIDERGATAQFPGLGDATLDQTNVWLKAWNWLRAHHVPVNAPADVPGQAVRTSQHLKGMAIDFIGPTLNDVSGYLADYAKSKLAKDAPLKIVGIVREPGCVHINLAPQTGQG